MPKRSSTKKLDEVQSAKRVFDHVIETTETTLSIVGNPSLMSQIMAEMGRRGGKIGGKRRLETMTDARRKEIASQAAKTRWAKVKKAKRKSA